MEKQRKAHCLVVSYPAQGHINPMLQFCKRLVHKGVRTTLVTTYSFWKTTTNELSSIGIESISDGYDEGGILAAGGNYDAYLQRFWEVGPQTLAELIEKLANLGCPADCVVFDSTLPWALDVAKKHGLLVAMFLTQSCAVNNIYYHVHQGLLRLPITETRILLPAMPELVPSDLPSFLYVHGSYPSVLRHLFVEPFLNIAKTDWVLSNTVYELEQEVVDWMMKIWPNLRTIGPTVPSMFLDKRIKDDENYGISLFKPSTEVCMKWLHDKPKGSVVYVSFGSLATLIVEQMEEIAWGLNESGHYFLWVVRASEEGKLPKNFVEMSEKGLIVSWCPQLQVLSHEAVGCFVTHCGWNSTLEALSIGVPMIGLPQSTDQGTNAKLIVDVLKTGLRAPVDEKGIVTREVVKHCLKEVMESERGKETQNNAIKCGILARKAADEGGSSDKHIVEFMTQLLSSSAACDIY